MGKLTVISASQVPNVLPNLPTDRNTLVIYRDEEQTIHHGKPVVYSFLIPRFPIDPATLLDKIREDFESRAELIGLTLDHPRRIDVPPDPLKGTPGVTLPLPR